MENSMSVSIGTKSDCIKVKISTNNLKNAKD
jgi:hypothetical protein